MPGVFNSFWLAFVHTLMFSVIMVPIAILLPLSLAILINQKPVGFKLFRALIYMPSIVPLTAAGTIFTLLFMPKAQNGLLAEFFGIEIKWFIDTWFEFTLFGQQVEIAYAWIPIFFMCLWGGWGGNFIILSAGLQNVPRHLYEAADIDGCSPMRKILSVTVPGIKPQLVLCLFTTILGYLGLYGQNFVLSTGGPAIAAIASMPAGGKTSTIMYFIQDIVANNLTFKSSLYGLGAAASLVYALFAGIISGIQMYLTREKKTGTKISEAYNKWHEIR
jgi:multiple sugar transport system permease protein